MMHPRNKLWCIVAAMFVTMFFYNSKCPGVVPRYSIRGDYYDIEFPMGGFESACSPNRHVLFIKTHKCASSTLQNILLQYGFKNNLTFALPESANYFGHPRLFNSSMLPPSLTPRSGKIDIFAMHSRLSEAEHRKVLHDDTKWITIIREPTAQFESMFNFYKLQNTYKFKLENIQNKTIKDFTFKPRGRFGRNQILFDLGLREDITEPELSHQISHFDNLFDLVLISEFMDESLILMRHLLCWSLNDIVTFSKNARRNKFVQKMSTKIAKKISEINKSSEVLYNYFLKRLKERVLEFGIERMAVEIGALKSLREKSYAECGVKTVGGRDPSLSYKEYSSSVMSYSFTNTSNKDCLLFSLPELSFITMVRDQQRENFFKARLKENHNS